MDIASLSTAMSTQNILNDVSVAMLSKSLDTVEDMGDGMAVSYTHLTLPTICSV